MAATGVAEPGVVRILEQPPALRQALFGARLLYRAYGDAAGSPANRQPGAHACGSTAAVCLLRGQGSGVPWHARPDGAGRVASEYARQARRLAASGGPEPGCRSE